MKTGMELTLTVKQSGVRMMDNTFPQCNEIIRTEIICTLNEVIESMEMVLRVLTESVADGVVPPENAEKILDRISCEVACVHWAKEYCEEFLGIAIDEPPWPDCLTGFRDRIELLKRASDKLAELRWTETFRMAKFLLQYWVSQRWQGGETCLDHVEPEYVAEKVIGIRARMESKLIYPIHKQMNRLEHMMADVFV